MATYTMTELREAAVNAATWTIKELRTGRLRDPETSEDIVNNETLLRVSGLTPPGSMGEKKDHDEWNVAWMRFREIWRDLILRTESRYPATVHGHGFRILHPNQNASYAENSAYGKAQRAISKGQGIVHNTNDSLLTAPERKNKADSEARLAAIASALRQSDKEHEKSQSWKAGPSTSNPSIPSVGTDKSSDS